MKPDRADRATYPYDLTFYKTAAGRQVALEWIRSLPDVKKQALGHYLHEILQRNGPAVCRSEWGRNLGGGLMEFRLRTKAPPESKSVDVLLRVFFGQFGPTNLVLLDGYDKGENPSKTYQNERIATARAYLRDFERRVAPTLSPRRPLT